MIVVDLKCVYVAVGRGYEPANVRKDSGDNKVIGRLKLDASYSPIYAWHVPS